MKKQELKQINFDIMIGNLRIDLFVWLWCVVKIYGSNKPADKNPKCGLRVECVGNTLFLFRKTVTLHVVNL